MKKIKAVFNWSGGKDSAHALWKAISSGKYDIIALLTTINRNTRLSTMHDIPISLLEEQSRSIGIPLYTVQLIPHGDMQDYSKAMEKAVIHFKQQGVSHFIFGDIFLHDVRSYREKQLAPMGMETVEPLWGMTSEEAIASYLDAGFKAVVVTTMDNGLGEAAIGKELDRSFLEQLPEDCDPNGENGEYHTFCYDGPIFSFPIPFLMGKSEKQSYDIRMENGSVQTFTYCFSRLESTKQPNKQSER